MKKVLLASLALLLLAFFALPAMASIGVDNTLVTQTADGNHYNINGLFYENGDPIQLFEPPRNVPPVIPPINTLWGQNNTSPLNGAGYPDYVPSPGASSGEAFDIEGVLWRYNPTSRELMVWVVSSVPTANLGGVDYSPDGVHHYNYYLGDVFINTDGVAGYDYALLSFNTTHPNQSYTPGWTGTNRDAGDLVRLSAGDTVYGINGPLSYAGVDGIPGQANPWAVNAVGNDPGAALVYDGDLAYQRLIGTTVAGGTTIQWLDDSRWGNATGATFVSFFDVFFDVDLNLENLLDTLAWHVTVQCGNDLGNGSGGEGGGGGVPAPGALILGIIGAGLVGLRRRMKA